MKASRLSDAIDPKAFFMMVNTNFGVLHHGGQIDLAPLWNAMAVSQPPAALHGVFLKFAESAEHLGLGVALPPQVASLDETERLAALQRFSSNGATDVVFGESGSFDALEPLPAEGASQLALATGDLVPFVPEETRRQITQHVVYAVKSAPVGQAVDAHHLAYLVDSNFEDLFDGQQFDVNPILSALRERGDFNDEDVYVAIVRLEQKLQGMGYAIAPVTLEVDPSRAQGLLEDAELRERHAAQEAANAVAQTRARSGSQVPEIGEPVPDESSEKKTRRDRSLEKYGIKKSGLSKRARVIRYAMLGVAAVAVGVFGVVTWPNRVLDTDDFATTIPLARAEVLSNGLQGVLEDDAWWSLSPEERTARLGSFREYVKRRGIANDLQIRDGQDRVVVAATRDGHIRAAKFFELGDRDGTIPEAMRKELAKDAPADAQKVMNDDGKQ